MSRCSRPYLGTVGFTLVELLVALAIMALLSLMSWRGLDAMGRAQRQTQARADTVQALQAGLAQWSTDLDAMAIELGSPEGAAGMPNALDWNGLVLRITRYSGSAAEPGLRVVAWTLGEDQGVRTWLRWQSPLLQDRSALVQAWQQAQRWAQSPGGAQWTGQVRITPLLDWQLFYYRGDAWSNPGSSSDAGTALPDGVRLQLRLPQDQPISGRLTRDWIRPTTVGTKS